MNVALLVRRQSYWFMKAVTASLGYPRKAAGYDAMFTVAKGSQASELTLPAGSLGQLQPVPDALKG